jgi:hypothetical protein
MVSQNILPTSQVAVRGAVQKTFIDATVLSGFMDAQHLQSLIGEYLDTLDVTARAQADVVAQATRAHVGALPLFVPTGNVIGQPIAGPHIDLLRANPMFQQVFGQRPHQFCYVDLTQLVALQPWVEPRADPIPGTEAELLEFALPLSWEVAAEVGFTPPVGPLQILTSNPALQGIAVNMEPGGRIVISAPLHPNLFNVVHFNGRHYLRNGYHRAVDALIAGMTQFPAIVTEGLFPQDVALVGMGPFNFGYVASLPRPPLLLDFISPASMASKVRERRYGVLVGLDVKPLNIGI